MDTTFLEDLTVEELKALIDACEVEINERKEEQKTNLMDEFEAWLKRVHEAGFEAWYNCEELCSWGMEITEE